jgi:uncharacterized protein
MKDTKAPEIDAVWAEYWHAASERRLVIQWCAVCQMYQFYPRRECASCFGKVEWHSVCGRGHVYSYTEVFWSPLTDFADRVPYIYALVDLDEGVRLTTEIVGALHDLHCGSVVDVDFLERDGRSLPVFRVENNQQEKES